MIPAGLPNYGNTCYLNACVQLLLRCPGISGHTERRVSNPVWKEWTSMQEGIQRVAGGGVYDHRAFVNAVWMTAQKKGADMFRVGRQNDLPECLTYLLEWMHENLCYSVKTSITGTGDTARDRLAIQCYTMLNGVYAKEYSGIMRSFYCIGVNTLKYADTGATKSDVPEHVSLVYLPVPTGGGSIYDCFRAYAEGERIEGVDDDTRQVAVIRSAAFWNLPETLVIVLKRFDPSNLRHKRTDRVTFPVAQLDLSEFVVGYNPQRYVYSLVGVGNHYGSPMGGHYTAYVQEGGKWWLCNDTNVAEVNADNLAEHAYCLVYSR